MMARNIETDLRLMSKNSWQTIDTLPSGYCVMLWEPMYGLLYGGKSVFSEKLEIKSTGNFWQVIPETINVTHWRPLDDTFHSGPEFPD